MEEDLRMIDEQTRSMNYMAHQLDHINHAALVLIDAYIDNGFTKEEALMILEDIVRMSELKLLN